MDQARASLSSAETNLSKASIRSPIDGVVLARKIEPGQTVAASFTAPVLFTLAEDLAQMELQVDVDEADVGQVRDGQSATFTVDAYSSRRYPAKITRVGYRIADQGRRRLLQDGPHRGQRRSEPAAGNDRHRRDHDGRSAQGCCSCPTPRSASRLRLRRSPRGEGGIVSSLLPRPPGARPGDRRGQREERQEQRAERSGCFVTVSPWPCGDRRGRPTAASPK